MTDDVRDTVPAIGRHATSSERIDVRRRCADLAVTGEDSLVSRWKIRAIRRLVRCGAGDPLILFNAEAARSLLSDAVDTHDGTQGCRYRSNSKHRPFTVRSGP
jgi:hypothetical protein